MNEGNVLTQRLSAIKKTTEDKLLERRKQDKEIILKAIE